MLPCTLSTSQNIVLCIKDITPMGLRVVRLVISPEDRTKGPHHFQDFIRHSTSLDFRRIDDDIYIRQGKIMVRFLVLGEAASMACAFVGLLYKCKM